MRFLKTNTATRVTVGPFLDKTDGITPETALTVTSEKLTLMVDDAGVPTLVLDAAPTASGGSNDMVHVTGDDAGFYDLELAAANLNYVGRAILSLTDAATHCPVFHEFMILPANVYDSLVGGSDTLQADVTQWLGTAVATPSVAGVPEVDLTHVAGATTNVAALATNVDAILTDTGTTLQGELDGIQADTEDIQSRLPAALTADGNIKADTLRVGGTLQTAGDLAALIATATTYIDTEVAAIKTVTDAIGATGSGLSAIPWNASWDAEVQSEVQDALEANDLDHIAKTATGIPAITAGTFLDQIMDDGTASYDRTTDSLQAIRDRGDSAWTTGGGASAVEFRGVVTKSGSTYYVSFVGTVSGAMIAGASLSSLVCTFYDEDGTDLTFSGTPAAHSTGIVYASGTLGTAPPDNRPIIVKIGATYGGTAYSSVLAAVNLA